jgi:hypothetical protein
MSRHIRAQFLIDAYNGTDCCPKVLETVDIRVRAPKIRKFSVFSFFRHCPARRASVINSVSNSVKILGNFILIYMI